MVRINKLKDAGKHNRRETIISGGRNDLMRCNIEDWRRIKETGVSYMRFISMKTRYTAKISP